MPPTQTIMGSPDPADQGGNLKKNSSYAAVTAGLMESSDDDDNDRAMQHKVGEDMKDDAFNKRHSSYMEAERDGGTPVQSPDNSPAPHRTAKCRAPTAKIHPLTEEERRSSTASMASASSYDLDDELKKTGASAKSSLSEALPKSRTGRERFLSNASYDLDEDELLNRALAAEGFGTGSGSEGATPKAMKRTRKLTVSRSGSLEITKMEKERAAALSDETKEKMFVKRSHIALEMLETEKTLVKALKQILDWYIKPLADKAGVNEKDIRWQSQILKKEQIAKVFNGIPELYRFHNAFIEKIQKAVDLYKDRHSGGIAEIFKMFPSKGLPPHLNYCNMFYVSMACLDENTQTNEAFAQFLQDKRSFHNTRQALKDLLIMPIQRVPRYVILIQRILESTPADHQDHDGLRRQMYEITRCAETINKRKGNVEAVDKLKNEITGLPGLPLYNGARYLVYEMKMNEVLKKDRRKERKMFLFDDMLVITTPRVKSRSQGILSSISANMSGNTEMFYQFRWKVNIDHTDDVKEIKYLTPEEKTAFVNEGEEDDQCYFKIVVKMDLPKKSHGGLSAGPSPLADDTKANPNMPWEWGTYTFSGDTEDVREFIGQSNMLMNNLKSSKVTVSKRNGFYETIRLVRQERRLGLEQGVPAGSSFEMLGEEVTRDELAREIEREHTLYGGYLKLVEAEQARANGTGAKARRKGMSQAAMNAAQKKDACYKRAKECEERYLEATGEKWATPLINTKAIIEKLEGASEKNSKGRWSSV